MHLVDSHAHLDSERYAEDLETVLRRAHDSGVKTILSIGIGDAPSEMTRALELARHFSGAPGLPEIYATAGIYPGSAHQAVLDDYAILFELAQDPKLIGIGEIGLDYYHVESPASEIQKACFIRQMEIAATVRKPIVIHCRTNEGTPNFPGENAWDDLLELIAAHWTPTSLGGIMHCFSGDTAIAQRCLDANFHLSFAGNVTYPKLAPTLEAAVYAPLDRILVETDAPWLAPAKRRGQRNESSYVTETAAFLAEARGITLEQISQATTENFQRLFHIT